MMKAPNEVLSNPGLWQTTLEKYALATHVTVSLFDADGRAALGPIHPTPLFQLFENKGYNPGIFAECARRCLAQTQDRPAVLVSRFHGLSAVGASLVLDGEIVGAAVAGYVFRDFSQVSEVQDLARQAGIDFKDLWAVARKQMPVPQSRLIVHGELLQVLGDALLQENFRTRQHEAELADTKLLQGISVELLLENDAGTLHGKILDAAAQIMGSQAASLQMLDPQRGELRLLSFRGFAPEAAKFWEWVRPAAQGAVCAAAVRRESRTIVEDVEKCEFLSGSQDLVYLRQCGIRACQSTPLVSRDGKILGMLSTHWPEPYRPSEHSLHRLDILARQAADLIERKQAEEERERLIRELERSNQDLAHFSHAVSHDLRSPAHTICSLTELLARRSRGKIGESEIQMLDMIVQSASGMQQLIDALLDYAQAGHAQMNSEDVPVGEVLEDVQVTLSALITETNTQILCGALPVVEADRVQLTQLFQNLVTNAVRYRRPEQPAAIEISCDRAQCEWQFAFKDNGQGIPRDSLEEVFEPLKRLHGSDVAGTGLGLALCRRIVERHGGRIWVESPGEGRGATFYFTLPGRLRPASTQVEEPCAQARGQSA